MKPKLNDMITLSDTTGTCCLGCIEVHTALLFSCNVLKFFTIEQAMIFCHWIMPFKDAVHILLLECATAWKRATNSCQNKNKGNAIATCHSRIVSSYHVSCRMHQPQVTCSSDKEQMCTTTRSQAVQTNNNLA